LNVLLTLFPYADDFAAILARARAAGVTTQILTGDCIPGATETINLANQHDGLYSTVGCHPCRANEWEAAEAKGEDYYKQLEELIEKGGKKVVAGEWAGWRCDGRAGPSSGSA